MEDQEKKIRPPVPRTDFSNRFRFSHALYTCSWPGSLTIFGTARKKRTMATAEMNTLMLIAASCSARKLTLEGWIAYRYVVCTIGRAMRTMHSSRPSRGMTVRAGGWISGGYALQIRFVALSASAIGSAGPYLKMEPSPNSEI